MELSQDLHRIIGVALLLALADLYLIQDVT